MHYLDNSATTAVLPEAVEAMTRFMLTDFGNPSSQHSMGIKAAKELKSYREIVAKAMVQMLMKLHLHQVEQKQ